MTVSDSQVSQFYFSLVRTLLPWFIYTNSEQKRIRKTFCGKIRHIFRFINFLAYKSAGQISSNSKQKVLLISFSEILILYDFIHYKKVIGETSYSTGMGHLFFWTFSSQIPDHVITACDALHVNSLTTKIQYDKSE